MSFYRPHAESGKLGKGGGMEWMDGQNFSPVFYMISDPLGPLPKKEKRFYFFKFPMATVFYFMKTAKTVFGVKCLFFQE